MLRGQKRTNSRGVAKDIIPTLPAVSERERFVQMHRESIDNKARRMYDHLKAFGHLPYFYVVDKLVTADPDYRENCGRYGLLEGKEVRNRSYFVSHSQFCEEGNIVVDERFLMAVVEEVKIMPGGMFGRGDQKPKWVEIWIRPIGEKCDAAGGMQYAVINRNIQEPKVSPDAAGLGWLMKEKDWEDPMKMFSSYKLRYKPLDIEAIERNRHSKW